MEDCIVTELYSPFYCGITHIDGIAVYFECLDCDENLISNVKLYKINNIDALTEIINKCKAYENWALENNMPDVILYIEDYLNKLGLDELKKLYPNIEEAVWEKAVLYCKTVFKWQKFLEEIWDRKPDFCKKARFSWVKGENHDKGKIEWLK